MKRFVFSYDDEVWSNETFSTIEEAMEEARKLYLERQYSIDERIIIYIGEVEYYKDGLFIDGIIEQQQQDAYSECGEYAEDYLESITKEEKDILKERLDKVWDEFKKEFGHEANFFKVINKKQITLKNKIKESELK